MARARPSSNDERGIGHVLCGGAPMDEPRGQWTDLAYILRQRLHDGNRHRCLASNLHRERLRIIAWRFARARDRFGRFGGNQAAARFGARQRGFEIEHGLEHGVVAEQRGKRVRRGQTPDESPRHHIDSDTFRCG